MESGGSDVEGDDEGGDGEGHSAAVEDKVYIPGQPLDEGEELVHDSSAYHMYHAVRPVKQKGENPHKSVKLIFLHFRRHKLEHRV